MDKDQYEHARSNAKGWFEEIRAAYRTAQADDLEVENTEERMREGVLSVEVREPWHAPGAEKVKPAEYNILLTAGGPGLRVWGELDNYGNADGAELQMQDWGMPWREVWPCEFEEMDEARAALLWFVGLFYFGD